ncbi:unnamed protein product [Sphenostylis stenocarpa]|uniref:Membrane insertase YidC/Oxa/ALB C-terminal domain-containing protein n=1 Tax=Sphenostylis stenocarpa TaxID=92480 RepID=A0AA86RZ87_9FABA|nr:unnamed protein product [Sphenostylis stenocarpa]
MPFDKREPCRSEGSENIDSSIITDVADVLTDATIDTVASQAATVNEVAIAAADSFLPVMGLQYVIDAIHSYTGLNWWASIVLTTLLIRSATVPLLINQLKATSKLTLMRPRLEEIKQQMDGMAMDPVAVAKGQAQMKKLFNEYGVSPFTPLKGLFIQGPIFVSFFLAISNMAEKVPSFKHGGAFWFTDLSTPDALYVFPVLTALSFLVTVECNMQEGMEGNPVAGTMKNLSRGLAVLTVPFTMGFPKAIFCYWVTSNLFSLVYGLGRLECIVHVFEDSLAPHNLRILFDILFHYAELQTLKVPGVKKTLGIPEIPVAAAPTGAPQSPFSIFPALKQTTSATNGSRSVVTDEPSKHSNTKISSSSVISQRLRSLEKQVKGRKKHK